MARSARAAGGTVKLTGSQLAELPEWLLRDAAADGMTQLLLGKNSLEELPDLRFAPRLSTLSVNGNRLQELRPASLPPSVEDFEAVNNQISAVHEAFLAELPKLTRFDLRGNLLTRECFEAAAGALPALRRLRILDLSSNRFVSFPDLVVSPPSLLELNLSLNPLAGPLPPLSRAAGLVRLSLVRCGLSDLPPEIMALPHLELLDVARNALAALPAPEARALRCLYAARNRRDVGTAAWPPWEPPRGRRGNRRVAAVGTAAWPPLEPPRGHHVAARLPNLDRAYARLPALVELDLSYNELTVWPDGLGSGLPMERLLLGHNRLTEVRARASRPRVRCVRVRARARARARARRGT